MKDRIKKLRWALKLSQDAFGARLGLSRFVIINLEAGRTEPNDRFISLVCRAFGVSESWLREGEGEMFAFSGRKERIAQFVNAAMADEEDDFREQFLDALSYLTADQWELIRDFADLLAGSTEE